MFKQGVYIDCIVHIFGICQDSLCTYLLCIVRYIFMMTNKFEKIIWRMYWLHQLHDSESLFLSLSPSQSPSLFQSISISISIPTYICISLSNPIFVSISISIPISIFISVYIPIPITVSVFISISTCISISIFCLKVQILTWCGVVVIRKLMLISYNASICFFTLFAGNSQLFSLVFQYCFDMSIRHFRLCNLKGK